MSAPLTPKLTAQGTVVLDGVTFELRGTFKVHGKVITIDPSTLKDSYVLATTQKLLEEIIAQTGAQISSLGSYKKIAKLEIKLDDQGKATTANASVRESEAKRGAATEEHELKLNSHKINNRIKAVVYSAEITQKMNERTGITRPDLSSLGLKPLSKSAEKELNFEEHTSSWFSSDKTAKYVDAINKQGKKCEKETQICCQIKNRIIELLKPSSVPSVDDINNFLEIIKYQNGQLEASIKWNSIPENQSEKITKINEQWKKELNELILKFQELYIAFMSKRHESGPDLSATGSSRVESLLSSGPSGMGLGGGSGVRSRASEEESKSEAATVLPDSHRTGGEHRPRGVLQADISPPIVTPGGMTIEEVFSSDDDDDEDEEDNIN